VAKSSDAGTDQSVSQYSFSKRYLDCDYYIFDASSCCSGSSCTLIRRGGFKIIGWPTKWLVGSGRCTAAVFNGPTFVSSTSSKVSVACGLSLGVMSEEMSRCWTDAARGRRKLEVGK